MYKVDQKILFKKIYSCIVFLIGSIGWAILAAPAATRWNLTKLCLWGCQHLFPRIWEASQESKSIAVIIIQSLINFLIK